MRILLLAFLGALALGGTGQPMAAPADRDTTVAIRTFKFRPGVLVIPAGTRVTWTNGDEIEHTVTAGIPDSSTGPFNGTLPAQGSAFHYRFERPGTFAYFCDRHRFMRGEIRVTPTGE